MKTTLEIPDALFRKAKARAAQQGIPLRQFVTEAVQEKLRTESPATAKPWIKLGGQLRHLGKETARIDQLIEAEFEQVDRDEWT